MSADIVNAPTVTTAPDRGARRFGLIVTVAVGAVIVLNLVASGVDHAVGGREPTGITGSSYGTQPDGLGAVSALFSHYGYPVARERGSLTDASLDPRRTIFVIEPQTMTDADDAVLLQFVSAGGRLVIGGSHPFYSRRLRDRPPVWRASGASRYPEIDPRLSNAQVVETAGRGSWESPGSGRVVAHAGDAALLTSERVGRGTIFFLADASPLENSYLDRADNAAFALSLAGATTRGVDFVEGVHGYGENRGVGAIPTPWKVALMVLGAAAVVLAWSRSRRFGPPDRPARDLPPARGEYVRALAVSLERTRDPGRALLPMQQWARSQVAQRAHLNPDATLEEIDRAAIDLGYSEAERAAIWHPTTDDDTALALGRLVARLSQHDGRTT